MPKRCALGCQPKSVTDTMHRFPNFERFPDRFKEWVQIVGGKLETESDYKKFQSRVICDKHFTDNFRNRYNRLNALAVPTLHLKGVKHGTLSNESNKSNATLDPLSTSNSSLAAVKHTSSDESNKSNTTLDPVAISNSSLEGLSDNEISAQVFKSEPIFDSLSTSDNCLSDCETSTQVAKPEPTLNHLSTVEHCVTGLLKQKTTNQNFKPEDSKGESTLSKPKLDLLSLITKEPLVTSPACNYNYNNSKKEHNYSVQDKPDTTKELKYHKPIVPPHIVHQLQTARKKIKLLQSEVSRLRKRNTLIKEKLINAKNNNKHSCLEKLTRNMTAAAKIFTHLQFSQTLKKNAGRRFTPEEQELSLSIFRSSPQCYNFLSKLFTLPSVKTLKNIIRKQQVNVMPGLDSSGNPVLTEDQPEPHDSSGQSVITFNHPELYKNNGETEIMFDRSEHYEDNEETVMMVDRSEHFENNGETVIMFDQSEIYDNNGETVIMVDQSELYDNNGETVIMVDQSELYENNGETVITPDQHERYETSENNVISFATTYEL